jgi:hypothetical protein
LLVQQSNDYELKKKRNLIFIKNLQKKAKEVKEDLINSNKNKNQEKKLNSITISINDELEGDPKTIIHKINSGALTVNKERSRMIKYFEEHLINSVQLKSTNKLMTSSNKFTMSESYDISKIEKEIFNKKSDVNETSTHPNNEDCHTTTNFYEDLSLKKYEEMNDADFIQLSRRKDFLVRENEKTEKAIRRIDEDLEKTVAEVRFSMDHQQRRLIILREV